MIRDTLCYLIDSHSGIVNNDTCIRVASYSDFRMGLQILARLRELSEQINVE
jgi:hypothetical protein